MSQSPKQVKAQQSIRSSVLMEAETETVDIGGTESLFLSDPSVATAHPLLTPFSFSCSLVISS